MGLCKCPKKKVTNLFCFEHRVNVCEHCLVSNHENCVVRSYLQWLEDSDYDPNCRLCGKLLSSEEGGPCIRLVCYDVFHWQCLDSYARQLPATTAPAGYTCPVCSTSLFPAPNVASPVADRLKSTVSSVNWARAGLGMPLIEERPVALPVHITETDGASAAAAAGGVTNTMTALPQSAAGAMHEEPAYAATHYPQTATTSPSSIVSVEEPSTPYARPSEPYTYPRRLFEAGEEQLLNRSHDHDDDKYKRRPALQWFSRWFQSRAGPSKKDPNATAKKWAVLFVLGLVGFFTVIIILSRLGRMATEDDPFLDPMANPNIKVQHHL